MRVNIAKGSYNEEFQQIDIGDIVVYDGSAVVKIDYLTVVNLNDGREICIAEDEMVTIPRDVEVNITL